MLFTPGLGGRSSGAWIRDMSFGRKGDGTFRQNKGLKRRRLVTAIIFNGVQISRKNSRLFTFGGKYRQHGVHQWTECSRDFMFSFVISIARWIDKIYEMAGSKGSFYGDHSALFIRTIDQLSKVSSS